VIDILIFLFDNYLITEEGMPQDEQVLVDELEEAGFSGNEITKAFLWLEALADMKEGGAFAAATKAPRIYLFEEQHKLGAACRGFLLQLEASGMLVPAVREIIIERAMAIDVPQLSLPQFKRIVGWVMLNSGHRDASIAWVEALMQGAKTTPCIH